MKKLIIIVLAAISIAAQAQTWKPISKSPGPMSGGFYEYLPAGYDGTRKFPLIVFLHGMGEMGSGNSTDLTKLATVGLPRVITNGQFPASFQVGGQSYSFIIICPQFTGWPGPTEVGAVVNYCLANYAVDTERIYLTGLSMGGGLTWEYAGTSAINASRLAAILPVCGAYSPNQAMAKIMADAGLAVWGTHNADDPTVTVQNTIGWTDQINANLPRIIAKRTIQATGGHNAWGWTYDPTTTLDGTNNAFQWLLQNKRGVVGPVVPPSFTPIRVTPGNAIGWQNDARFFSQTVGIPGMKAVDIWGYTPAIQGTTNPALYQVENFGDMQYSFPVPAGTYTVTLYFSELYWNGPGKRVFSVDAEGARVMSNLDIWAATGGRFRAMTRNFDVQVTDGILNLNFVRGSADLPKISAIEINQKGAVAFQQIVTVEYRDSATNALIRARTDTFSIPVKTVIK